MFNSKQNVPDVCQDGSNTHKITTAYNVSVPSMSSTIYFFSLLL